MWSLSPYFACFNVLLCSSNGETGAGRGTGGEGNESDVSLAREHTNIGPLILLLSPQSMRRGWTELETRVRGRDRESGTNHHRSTNPPSERCRDRISHQRPPIDVSLFSLHYSIHIAAEEQQQAYSRGDDTKPNIMMRPHLDVAHTYTCVLHTHQPSIQSTNWREPTDPTTHSAMMCCCVCCGCLCVCVFPRTHIRCFECEAESRL